jgi:transposase
MSRKKNKGNKGNNKQRPPSSLSLPADLPLQDIAAIVERTQTTALNAADHATLKTAVDALATAMGIIQFMKAELQSKKTSIDRLRRVLFGAKTENTHTVLGEEHPLSTLTMPTEEATPERRPAPPGHGRNAAAAYTGADKVSVRHPSVHSGDACAACEKGKVYPLADPSVLVRITGVAPLGATVYECDRLRCNLCGEVYTAAAPEGVGEEKYDATASSMIGLLKYGTGLPFNRIEALQQAMRIPMPAATQWDLVKESAQTLAPAHEELIRGAAQGSVVYNDDTTMKVLDLTREQRAAALSDEASEERTGVFTSGIVATDNGRKIALFFTGARHAGENLEAVLERRAAELPMPIQMCDALSSNSAGDFETLMANCLAHSRRRYVEVADSFPEEVRFVLETLREVYKTEALARKDGLNPDDRLRLHQDNSAPRMQALENWMQAQFAGRKVEPNSTLGDAIRYMQSHWPALTLFLRVAGAPLDNNITERALKKAILHRKNALFFKTLNGARVGDIFMSLIHTAELNGIAPFDYLVALQRHAKDVCVSPGDWMPWNYQTTLERRSAGPDPPA